MLVTKVREHLLATVTKRDLWEARAYVFIGNAIIFVLVCALEGLLATMGVELDWYSNMATRAPWFSVAIAAPVISGLIFLESTEFLEDLRDAYKKRLAERTSEEQD